MGTQDHRKLIGDKIRNLRQKAGLSQEKLAEKAELHSVYISQVERAERNITIESLLKITRILQIPLSDLVQGL